MRRIRTRSATGALVAAFLTACQTTAPAPPPPAATTAAEPAAPALSDAPGRVVAQNKGWVVRAHPPSESGPAFCHATRQDSDSALLAFRATAKEAAMLVKPELVAPKPSKSGRGAHPGAGAGKLTAVFPDGERLALEARPTPDGDLVVPVQLPTYEDLMEPFARSKAVTFQGDLLGGAASEVSLGGSSWAISALDECRILHTEN